MGTIYDRSMKQNEEVQPLYFAKIARGIRCSGAPSTSVRRRARKSDTSQ